MRFVDLVIVKAVQASLAVGAILFLALALDRGLLNPWQLLH